MAPGTVLEREGDVRRSLPDFAKRYAETAEPTARDHASVSSTHVRSFGPAMLAVTAPKNRGTIGLIVGYLGCVGVIFAAHETCQSEALELLLDGQIECADKRRLAAVEAETLRERAEEIRLRHRALIVGAGPIHTHPPASPAKISCRRSPIACRPSIIIIHPKATGPSVLFTDFLICRYCILIFLLRTCPTQIYHCRRCRRANPDFAVTRFVCRRRLGGAARHTRFLAAGRPRAGAQDRANQRKAL